MVSVCIYFQVHQPLRIRKYTIFDIGKADYFSDNSDSNLNNKAVINKISNKCYLNANKILMELLKVYPKFRVAFSFSGVFLEQIENFRPDVLKSFQELVRTGRVEILSETYHHSLSYIFSKEEFNEQVRLHRNKIKEVFNYEPKVLRNTELIYSDELARDAEALGYLGVLSEGLDSILKWRSPNFVYRPPNTKKIKVLLKNYRLSDDIAFRFSERSWSEWPLDASKFSSWINKVNGNGQVVNLFMDYETFGEHQWEETGIFEFLRHLPGEILKNKDNDFKTPSEVVESCDAVGEFSSPNFISWADVERDFSAWVGNEMQEAAIKQIYNLGPSVIKTNNPELIEIWRKLQISDHFYYMCTKWFSDGDVHKYFNPYESPYDAFINYMNVLQDLKLRVEKALKKGPQVSVF